MKKIKMILLLVTFLIVSNVGLASELTDMKKKVKTINQGIKNSNKQIRVLTARQRSVETRIRRLEKEIPKTEREIRKLGEEIKAVNKKIDYSKRSMNFSDEEKVYTQNIYNSKLIAYSKINNIQEDDGNVLDLKTILTSDLTRLEEIRVVQKNLDLIKIDIEKDKKKLGILQKRLFNKRIKNRKNKAELNRLIRNIKRKKGRHVTNITKLKKERKRIEKAIQNIIKRNTKKIKNISYASARQHLGKLHKPVAGSYAVSFHQKKKGNIISNGIEIKSHLGRIVRAASSGKVIFAGSFQGLGNVVMIDYGYNMIGVYGNLIMVKKKVGEKVSKREQIGILGMSVDQKPYLYYELRFNLKPINPVSFF